MSIDNQINPEQGWLSTALGMYLQNKEQALFDDYLAVHGNSITAKSPANLAHLSETDVEALDDVVARFGKLTPSQLSKLSHRDVAWNSS